MAPGGFRLIALLAPGSVEAGVGRIQQDIFARHGFVSAVALPPVVPVSFLPEGEPQPHLLRELNELAPAPYRCAVGSPAWHEGVLYLGVDSGDLWHELRRGARARGADAAGFFPVYEGFFLGCAEASTGLRDLIRPGLPDTAFSSARLALMLIETPEPQGTWWRDVSWEIVDEMPLRGRRRS